MFSLSHARVMLINLPLNFPNLTHFYSVTYFSICDPFFQMDQTVKKLSHFDMCSKVHSDPFFQMGFISQGVKHFSQCALFSQSDPAV